MTAGGVFSLAGPRIFSIAAGRPFLTDLARELTASLGAAGAPLAEASVYLPTRRAARALGEAFLAVSGRQAALTPRIYTLGDIDEDALCVDDDIAAGFEDEMTLAPAISSARRRLILARFIAEKEKTFFDGQRHWAGAIGAADELARLLDSLYTEEIPPARLADIAPEGLAAHWRRSLEFLDIVTATWPDLLAAEGLADPAARRMALIDAQTRRWRARPPGKPVIIAGTTGSAPAVARMIRVVAEQPLGCVVLPGLDLDADARVWDAVDDPHPQSGLKALLQAIDIPRSAVRRWPGGGDEPRSSLVAMALRPAAASDDWLGWTQVARAAGADIVAGLEGLSLVEADDEDAEAAIIALSFRETLETPGKTAMLVTPDRDLARRVAMKMRRWGVSVDDSGGAPFANTPCGVYLRLVASWLAAPSDPVRVMALCDHDLFAAGLAGDERRRLAGRLDRALRGLRPADGIDGLRAKLAPALEKHPDLALLVDALASAHALWPRDGATFPERFDAHIAAAEQLAASDRDDGAARLWRDDDGAAGAELLAVLRAELPAIVHDAPEDYAAIFDRLIAGAAVRRRAPAHPRLSILGPLEARLQTADRLILGGLNEGVWPRDASSDPFLSRPMRERLGLPSPERRIGLAAHDFAQLAAAPEVVLTRALRAAGKPSRPSRWIVRLRNILAGAGLLERVEHSAAAGALAAGIDRETGITRIDAPRPQPPVASRPRRFSVTDIGTLLRDPYAVYAKRILGLRKLDALSEPFSSRDFGNFLHTVLEDYAASAPLPDFAARKQVFTDLYDRHARGSGLEARNDPFWRARVLDSFDRFDRWHQARLAAGAVDTTEVSGGFEFIVDGEIYEVHARADRIDREHDGAAFIIDYKTGAPPTLQQTHAGFSPQLPLTGLIVSNGGFEDLGPRAVSGFEYVQVVAGAGEPALKSVRAEGDEAARLIATARGGFEQLMRHFANPDTVYPSQPRPQFVNPFGDYDHLARRRERNAQGGDDGDEGGE